MPTLRGEELDTAVKAYVENIQKLGGVVNTAIVLGGAAAIISHDVCGYDVTHKVRSRTTYVIYVCGILLLKE